MTIPKAGEEAENDLLQWAKFLNGKREEDFKEMAEKNEYINEAYQILKNISADDQKRYEYESREKAIRDHNHMIYMAKKEGWESGREAGIEVFIQYNLEEGIFHDRIVENLQKRFNLNYDIAEKYYEKYK